MTDRRAVALFLLGPWFAPEFWDDVEYETTAVDLDDFEEFQAGEHGPAPRPEFEEDLRARLRAFAASRYASSK